MMKFKSSTTLYCIGNIIGSIHDLIQLIRRVESKFDIGVRNFELLISMAPQPQQSRGGIHFRKHGTLVICEIRG